MRWWLVGLALSFPASCLADNDSVCHGRDLLAALAAEAPADFGRINAAAKDMPFNEGRLFRLTRPGLSPSYLFGTVHLADPQVAALSAGVRAALSHARTVAVESVDEHGRLAATQTKRAIAAPDGFKASQLLAPGDFRRLEQLVIRRGLPAAVAHQYKPVALALVLDIPNCAAARNQPGAFLDARVLEAAREAGLPTIGIETLAEQVDIADDLTAAEQTALLQSVLAQSDRAEDSVQTTVAAYQSGQIGLLLAWTQASTPIPGVAAAGTPKAVLDRLVTARTARMADRLLPLLDKGGVFIAVGVNHIPGADGLAMLLQKAGYAIDKVE